VGLLGLVLVIGAGASWNGAGITPLNVGVVVGAMLASTAGTIYQKRFAADVPLRTGTIWQYLGALLPSAIYAFAFESFYFEWTGELVFAFVWLVVVLSIISIFLLMILIRRGSVAQVASLFYLVPPSTAVIAYFLFGERLLPIQLLGMVLCAIGVRMAVVRNAGQVEMV
ncbi:MAG TPA: DMT family transporter, partial [Devosia sp.]|nr:DMT family transporter [Devosia sp.]